MFGAPAITCMPARLRRLRRRHGHREFADAMPSAAFSAISCLGPVVVAGQRDVAAGDAVEQRAAVRDAQSARAAPAVRGCGARCSRRPARPAPQRAIEIEIGVLADAGTVIHQADHAHQRVVGHACRTAPACPAPALRSAGAGSARPSAGPASFSASRSTTPSGRCGCAPCRSRDRRGRARRTPW